MDAPQKAKANPVAPGSALWTSQSDDEFTPDQKRLATLRARAALAGVTLYQSTTDTGQPCYIVSRWALTRQLESLDAAEHWLDQVTGVKHE
jgi:hypothetical protein